MLAVPEDKRDIVTDVTEELTAKVVSQEDPISPMPMLIIEPEETMPESLRGMMDVKNPLQHLV